MCLTTRFYDIILSIKEPPSKMVGGFLQPKRNNHVHVFHCTCTRMSVFFTMVHVHISTWCYNEVLVDVFTGTGCNTSTRSHCLFLCMSFCLLSQLVNLTTNKPSEIWRRKGVHGGGVHYCSFSPDSNKIISCGYQDECHRVSVCMCTG